jgi:hypothetical protein
MTTMSVNKLQINESDFWEELYKAVPILIQPGEKTIPMMMDELDREVTHNTMSNQVKQWVKEGKLVSVGMRISNGKLAKAYKPV